MQEKQIKIFLYENYTDLKAEFTLPDSDKSHNTLIKLKTEWEKKTPNNIAKIQSVEK